MASPLSARLDRTDSSTPWGFRLHGGKDFSSPLTIQRITPGSLAAKCGLQVGDMIVKIGETATDTLRHKEAQSAVISSGNSLDLSIKRGGPPVIAPSVDSYQPTTPSYGGFNNTAPQSYSTNYNVKPKPFTPGGGGGYSGVDGLSSTTANLNLGPGNEQEDVSSSHGSEDLPPPPPPMHEGGGSMYEPPPPAPPPLPAASFSTPSPWKPSSGTAPKVGTVTPKVPAAPGTKAPVKTPTQSAVFEEEHDADDVPKYRGYTNPSMQSRTFKMLQQQVDSGEETPGSGLVKPQAQTTPVQPAGKANDQGRVKAIMNRQYNSPSKLYSDKKAQDTYVEQSTNIIENLQRADRTKQTQDQDGKKAYVASETFRMVQELDGKEPSSEPPKPRTTAFNPLSGKYGSAMRADDADYKADDPNSPLYKPTESASYKASLPVEGSATKGGPYPMPPHAAPKHIQPTPRPEPTIVGSAYPSQDVADTIIQNRSTITISPRPSGNTNAASTPSAFKPKGPKPFSGGFPADSAPSSVPAAAPPAPSGGGGGGGGGGSMWKPTVPTGDRQMRVGKMGEARSMPATGGAGRIPICNSCGTAIRGPFVLALDKSWCPDHFNCANPSCRCPLIDVGFVEEDGQLYCEKDYEQFMAPRCGKCGGAIVGSRIDAMNQNYHPHCFVCNHCREPIGGTSFHVEQNEFYCQKDWAQLFQTKCYGCQFPIEPGDRWVEALGQNWHSECFNCSTCQVNLEGQPFFAKAGKPFCKKHAAAGGGRFG